MARSNQIEPDPTRSNQIEPDPTGHEALFLGGLSLLSITTLTWASVVVLGRAELAYNQAWIYHQLEPCQILKDQAHVHGLAGLPNSAGSISLFRLPFRHPKACF